MNIEVLRSCYWLIVQKLDDKFKSFIFIQYKDTRQSIVSLKTVVIYLYLFYTYTFRVDPLPRLLCNPIWIYTLN